ncbi:unnamed protein product [Haemonchus placei]|uniref:ANK_REP_REGION domain-containing protein n=1 Tax=Haemonchus placei TaxID=6290 RepID=A0A158QKF2_HAEPC|nr:unnamed protein product [Haemonchus placei]
MKDNSLIAKVDRSHTMSTRRRAADKCRCCPYGFHIDVDFVAYAEDVRKGGTIRTSSLPRKNGERSLMSPLDSIFSDSLENILSDFDDALGVSDGLKANQTLPRQQRSRLLPRDVDKLMNAKRIQDGYASDHTGYYTDAPPKPLHQPSQASQSPAYTALGRTITEIKARNTESPFPERDVVSRIGSRVGTPIDLGLPNHNVSTSLSRPRTPRRLESDRERFRAEPTILEHPYQHALNGKSYKWRLQPSLDDRPASGPRTNNGCMGDFASLRRGREYAVSDSDTSNRVRYYSASPKMPRKLQAVPPLPSPSQFTYTHHNGSTRLAKTQGTSMSPPPDTEKTLASKETVSIGVCTAPPPPAKPCAECTPLRKELQEVLKRLDIAEVKPELFCTGTLTDEVPTPEALPRVSIQCHSIGTSTDHCSTVECGVDAIGAKLENTECQTSSASTTEVGVATEASVADIGMQIDDQLIQKTNFGVNTDPVEEPPSIKMINQSTAMDDSFVPAVNQQVANAVDELSPKRLMTDQETMTVKKYYRNIPSQTIIAEEAMEQKGTSAKISAAATSSDAECQTETDSTVDSTASDDVIGDTVVECSRCRMREEAFTRNVGVGACSVSDKVEKDDSRSKEFDRARVEAVKKLLTSEQKQPFVRGTAVSRSARMERVTGDDLEYITTKNRAFSESPQTPTSTPSRENKDALKTKVVLKKEIPSPPSIVPDPVPARIPRPKVSKYVAPAENAETPDEEEEAVDRLTPLRNGHGRTHNSPTHLTKMGGTYLTSVYLMIHLSIELTMLLFSDSDEDSDDSEGSYDTHEDGDWALKYVQHEWLKCTARKGSKPEDVDLLIKQIRELSPALLKVIVNITDQNGNTALHYAVSHGNFGVVSSLLDSAECKLNLANRAGYSAVMLAALSSLENDVEKAVVQRLFELGDVNARAQQHGQTALMLSVSHGKKATTELLLACGADVNLQDEEGSTALMCAAEHGHKDIVKLLLGQPGIDAALTDCDSSTALSIAVENGHRDIGVLIYAHLNYSRVDTIQESC